MRYDPENVGRHTPARRVLVGESGLPTALGSGQAAVDGAPRSGPAPEDGDDQNVCRKTRRREGSAGGSLRGSSDGGCVMKREPFSEGTRPFSVRDSFLVLSWDATKDVLTLRHIRGGDERDDRVAAFRLLDDERQVACHAEIVDDAVELTHDNERVLVAFEHPSVLRVENQSRRLRLSVHWNLKGDDYITRLHNCWEVNMASQLRRFWLRPARCVEPGPDGGGGVRELVVPPSGPEGPQTAFVEEGRHTPVGDARQTRRRELDADRRRWREAVSVPARFREAGAEAAQILWSSLVAPESGLSREAMYMSKSRMTNVWAWDHCFNAMALIKREPAVAFDQFMLLFDYQDDNGSIPDYVNDRLACWNFVKPPIHGWAYRWMRKKNPDWFTASRDREVYGRLAAWTQWWLNERDDYGTGLPCYRHGNDSGWDNATPFVPGVPLTTPDLPAYLVIQMSVLEDLAHRLGDDAAAVTWRSMWERLLDALVGRCWDPVKGRFTPLTDGPVDLGERDSLLMYIPLVLGALLPDDVRRRLIEGVGDSDRFWSPHGLATESLTSPFFTRDGYWRGPVWAPVVLLFWDALQQAGAPRLAESLARRFCGTVDAHGFYENFDATTGQGLRDSAFTWTASVFLILAESLAS